MKILECTEVFGYARLFVSPFLQYVMLREFVSKLVKAVVLYCIEEDVTISQYHRLLPVPLIKLSSLYEGIQVVPMTPSEIFKRKKLQNTLEYNTRVD